MISSQITITIVLMLLCSYFSATETAFLNLNRARIKSMSEKGNKKAGYVLKLAENNNSEHLSAVLVGKKMSGAGIAVVATLLFTKLFGGENGFVGSVLPALLAVASSALLLAVFCDMLPTTLAKDSPEKIAILSAPVLRAVIILLTPFTMSFLVFKKLLSKVFKPKGERKMTQDELLTLVDEVEQEGGIDRQESEFLRSAIEFTDREASDILTPRTSLEAVSLEMKNEEIAKVFNESGYSRLPIFSGTIDDIVGVIHQKDFVSFVHGTENSIETVLKKPVYIPLTMKISDILKLLQKNKSHMAIVVDEYGGTMGIVTMEDILEELVGEIWDEHDEIVENVIKIADNQYKVITSSELDKLFRFFSISDETDSSTVNGWILEKFGRFPQVGDKLDFANLSIEVTDADGQKVNEVFITVKQSETDNSEEYIQE